ncbi:MAG: NlpC/P60 family protein [Chloroflexi bacterium]|nr:MAG: NlpC/P60 family protein [Chloroflexota bacterium]
MEATQLTTRTRVAMVWPEVATVASGVVDVRAEADDAAELVDQAHFGEQLRVLGERGEWLYVQGEDDYFGWIRSDTLSVESDPHPDPLWIVATTLAPVRADAAADAEIIGEIPAGARLSELASGDAGDWLVLSWRRGKGFRRGYVAAADTAPLDDLPRRPPTPADLLATAQAFIGSRYVWGGTTERGLDCSGFVQQVYRLNGVGLPRDADQQAVFGRPVERASPGDLFFFGAERVTHVALATSESEFLHAPQSGAVVERGKLGPERRLRTIRRYLPENVRET